MIGNRPIGWEHAAELTPAEIQMREEQTAAANAPFVPSERDDGKTRPVGWEHSAPLTPAEIAMREGHEFSWIHPEIVIGLSQLTDDERYILSRALAQPGDSVNLGTVLNGYTQRKANRGRTERANYQAIYRAVKRLQIRGLGTVTKPDGLVNITVHRSKIAQVIRNDRAVHNLLDKGYLQNSNLSENQAKKGGSYDHLAIPKNASGRRLAAINFLHGVDMLNRRDRKVINTMFAAYDDEVSEKIIALISSEGEVIGSQYSTRFNDLKKAAISLKKYDYAVDKSLEDYNKAVFLTLTTDPKRFKNLWEANRNFSKSWNKFLSVLTKRFGQRPKYITAFEYTKSGLMHCHAIIFVEYLMNFDEISKVWSRIGQAEVIYIYALHNQLARGGKKRQWIWLKSRPKDKSTGRPIRTRSGTDYLKKYLKKATLAMVSPDFEDENGTIIRTDRYNIQSLYWAFNKRFWTSSRCFLPDPEEIPPESPVTYSFYGVYHQDSPEAELIDYMIYYRGGEHPDYCDSSTPPPDEVVT